MTAVPDMEFNYSGKLIDRQTDEMLSSSGGVLLHCCCAPCATSVIERVIQSVKPVLYYYNPNIQPEAEYDKRLGELEKLAAYHGLELIAEPYRGDGFLSAVKGLESEREGGARCPICFSLRLDKTAETAAKLRIPAFCSTLTVSPHKDAELINEIGLRIEKKYGVKWILSDFKKRNGFLRSTQICEELGLYRQNYCGCLFAVKAEK